jgi:hypothetical protein
MKKTLVLIGALMAGVVASFAQGTIYIYNSATAAYDITTNGAAGGQGTGNTAGVNQYYYAILMSTYGGATPADNPSAGAWTFSGLYATNYLNGGIRTYNNTTGVAINGWPLAGGSYAASTPEYYMIVGWSASYGLNEATVISDYQNGTLTPGTYFGFSPVAYQVGGNPGNGLSANNLLGNSSGVSGAGLLNGFSLNEVVTTVPEPGTMALAGLGGLAMLAFRRKK